MKHKDVFASILGLAFNKDTHIIISRCVSTTSHGIDWVCPDWFRSCTERIETNLCLIDNIALSHSRILGIENLPEYGLGFSNCGINLEFVDTIIPPI